MLFFGTAAACSLKIIINFLDILYYIRFLLTVVQIGHLVFKVDQGGGVVNAEFFGGSIIVNFDKLDTISVAFVINFLKLIQHSLGFLVVIVICAKFTRQFRVYY